MSNLKLSYQLKKGHKSFIIHLRMNMGLKLVHLTQTAHSLTYDQNERTYIETTKELEDLRKYCSVYISTGLIALPQEWDSKKQRMKDDSHPYNQQLNNIEKMVLDIWSRNKNIQFMHEESYGVDKGSFFKDLVQKLVFGKKIKEREMSLVDNQLMIGNNPKGVLINGDSEKIAVQSIQITYKEENKEKVRQMYFVDYISIFQDRSLKSGNTKSTVDTYNTIKSWIVRYNEQLKVKDINENSITDFFRWARQQKKKDGSYYAYSHINGSLQKSFKAVILHMKAYDKIDLEISWGIKELKKSTEKSFEVSLSLEMLKKIIQADLTELKKKANGNKYDLSVDYITLGCLLGLRISDLSVLNLVNLKGVWYVYQELIKTPGVYVKFQVHKKVVEIWQKYNCKIPYISEGNLNLNIKKIGEFLYKQGHNEFGEIQTIKRKNPANQKEYVIEKKEFFRRLKTSSFRRTFITFAVASKSIEYNEILKLSGHSNIKQMLEYVEIPETKLNESLNTFYKELDL